MTGKVVHTSTVARREDCDEVGTMFLREPNVYIGRYYFWGAGRHFEESPFHNPYRVKKYGRDEALMRFEKYIRAPEQAHLRDRLGELKGKTLCCWCARKPDGDPNVPEVLTLKDPTVRYCLG